MEHEIDECLFPKLQLVFNKLISPEFRISDDTAIQKLFDSLSSVFLLKECQEKIIEMFVPWFDSVTFMWKDIHQKSQIFALKLSSLICQSENGFYIMKKNHNLKKICDIYRYNRGTDFSLSLAYIEIISTSIKHSTGLLWFREMGCWNDVLEIALYNRSLFALRKSRNLIAEIIFYHIKDSISDCKIYLNEVFHLCCVAIDDFQNHCFSILRSIQNEKELIPDNLNIFKPIILLKEICLNLLHNKVPLCTLSQIGLDKIQDWAWRIMEERGNFMVLSNMSKLLCVINIIFTHNVGSSKINYSKISDLRKKVINHCSILIKKKEFKLVQDACIDYLMLWNHLHPEVVNDVNKNSTIHSFESTPFAVLTLPLYIFLCLDSRLESDKTDAFNDRVFDGSCVQTKGLCNLYQEHLKMHCYSDIPKNAESVIHCYMRIKDISKREQGELVFQTLVHVLKKIIPKCRIEFDSQVSDGTRIEEQLSQYFPLLSSTLEALCDYISHFGLDWHECLEKLSVLLLLQEILNTSHYPPRIYISALRVSKVALISYLPESIVLDEINSNNLYRLVNLLYKLLHSVHWEVRDSALELLQIIITLVEKKLPKLQPILLENDLPNVLISVIQNDSEAYVRASALSCLYHMVPIRSVWNSVLKDKSLLDITQTILTQDPEGVVRYKSIFLIKNVYIHHQLSNDSMEKVYDLLSHVTISDLHWEVKKACIIFWDNILDKLLIEEGMINGEFNNHTDLHEKEKMNEITPTEISLKILKIFQKLDEYGCLHVLWEVVRNDCDIEVTKEAGKLVKKMFKLMEKFSAYPHLKNTETDAVSLEYSNFNEYELNKQPCSPKHQSKKPKLSTEEVIESIVSEGDLNLLTGLLKVDHSKPITTCLKVRVKLGVNKFVTELLMFDVIKSENEKIKWISKTSDGIISLLDDLLLSTKYCKINDIDCY